MKRKEFFDKVESIINNSELEIVVGNTENQRIIKNTIFGDINFMLDFEPKIKIYSLYMRFFDVENINKNYNLFDEDIKPNNFSGKWNVHTYDPSEVLNIFEERINKIKYLTLFSFFKK